MTATTFDTLKHVKTFKATGFDERQAKVLAETHADVSQQSLDCLVTKQDLDGKLEKELSPIKTDLAVIKWMLGVLLAAMVTILLKTFLPH